MNHVELEGTVHGEAWTSYGRGERGRVNFWLGVSRDLAGNGYDLLHCAVEHHCAAELGRLHHELRDGRTVKLVAQARSQVNLDGSLLSQAPAVIFIAGECGLDGQPPHSAHRLGLPARRHHVRGKAAAAGDVEFELPISEEAR